MECFGGHDHSVDAVTALCGLLPKESLLNSVKVPARAEPFQSGYLFSPDGIDSNRARTDGLTLEDDCTRSTLTQAATKLRPIQLKIISKYVQKRSIRSYINGL
jgi:hypothetical protein